VPRRRVLGTPAPRLAAHLGPPPQQQLFILTMSADRGVPVQFRCAAGNTNDAETHRQTWDTLRAVAGRPDFLYVADSKLCTREQMDYLDRHGGRL
jgi:transposase